MATRTNKKYNEYRNWLCEIEHELIERGMSSCDASRLIEEREATLKIKYALGVLVVRAANWICNNK